MYRLIAALLLLALAGCSQATTVAMAPPGQDAAGKQFAAPPPGMGAIYFYNPSTASPLLYVSVDGLYIGQLGTQTWMRAEFNAGHHVLRCRGGNSGNALWVNVAPGDLPAPTQSGLAAAVENGTGLWWLAGAGGRMLSRGSSWTRFSSSSQP